MTIKDVEARSGVARANIRYYEAEGLLSPQRLKNGYRSYSEEDLAVLEKIKLLRRLGVGVEELRGLERGGADLPAVLDRRLAELGREQAVLSRVEQVCGDLRAEAPTFETLEPKKYLEALDAPDPGLVPPPLPAADALPVVTNLGRRLAARILDWFFLLMLAFTVPALLGRNPTELTRAAALGLGLEVFQLAVEPLLLHLFAATPGKALLGLRITRRDGEKLSYGEGVNRHLWMLWEALGLWIPIWSWIQLYKCCKRWSEEEPQPWDEGFAYTAQPFRVKRHLGGVALACLAALAMGEAANSASQLPPNRGDLSVAEFAENYNRQAVYLGGDSKNYLDGEGRWQTAPDPPGTVTLGLRGTWTEGPSFQYTLEDGAVRAVTLECAVENTDQWMGLPRFQVLAAATALVWGRPETSFWYAGREPLVQALDDADLGEDFTLRQDGVNIAWEVESRNFDIYSGGDLAFPQEGMTENFLSIRCTLALED